ncbi:hypothetical protein GAY31_04450 [Azospirillum brasilense]|nr:hypothetical protein [Azospirillum brasilense]
MRKATEIIAFWWRGAPVDIGNVSLPVHTVDCQSNQQDCATMFAISLDAEGPVVSAGWILVLPHFA